MRKAWDFYYDKSFKPFNKTKDPARN